MNILKYFKPSGLCLALLLVTNTIFPRSDFRTGINTPIGRINFTEQLNDKTVLYAAALALLIKIGYDVSWHNEYSDKAYRWMQQLDSFVNHKNITLIQDPNLGKLFFASDFDEMFQYLVWLNKSYNSWLTPWNWTTSQKKAINQIKAVSMLTVYNKLLNTDEENLATELKKFCREKFSGISAFPLVTAVEIMQDQQRFATTCPIQTTIIMRTLLSQIGVYLDMFKRVLRQDGDYVAELQTKRTQDLQREMVQAIQNIR
jgi:hypothetical protein